MKITLLGAAGEVTGSGYLVKTARARVLVDFGMFQGRGDFSGAMVENQSPPGCRLNFTSAHINHHRKAIADLVIRVEYVNNFKAPMIAHLNK